MRAIPRGAGALSGTVLSLVAAGALGAAAGTGGFTFIYAKGASYLGHDAAACANCHIMEEQYGAWLKGSHHDAAVCNDCHTPVNPLGKYAVKGLNGFRHSLAFTTGWFHEPIQITALNRSVAEGNCRECHADMVGRVAGPHGEGETISCIRCHESVGHLQ